jgi:hypothetical protein
VSQSESVAGVAYSEALHTRARLPDLERRLTTTTQQRNALKQALAGAQQEIARLNNELVTSLHVW